MNSRLTSYKEYLCQTGTLSKYCFPFLLHLEKYVRALEGTEFVGPGRKKKAEVKERQENAEQACTGTSASQQRLTLKVTEVN